MLTKILISFYKFTFACLFFVVGSVANADIPQPVIDECNEISASNYSRMPPCLKEGAVAYEMLGLVLQYEFYGPDAQRVFIGCRERNEDYTDSWLCFMSTARKAAETRELIGVENMRDACFAGVSDPTVFERAESKFATLLKEIDVDRWDFGDWNGWGFYGFDGCPDVKFEETDVIEPKADVRSEGLSQQACSTYREIEEVLGSHTASELEGIYTRMQTLPEKEVLKSVLELGISEASIDFMQSLEEREATGSIFIVGGMMNKYHPALLDHFMDMDGVWTGADPKFGDLADQFVDGLLGTALQAYEDQCPADSISKNDNAAKLASETTTTDILTEIERQAALLSTALAQLAEEKSLSVQSQRDFAALNQIAALNQQVAALRSELGSLQALLDAAADADSDAQVRIEALGSQLNTALARAAQEAKRAADLEAAEAERLRIEAERLQNQVPDLEDFRSEFFGTLRQVLGDREEIQIVGDRFVFSSEVLFESASATLSAEGKSQISSVANVLAEVAVLIPSSIDWIIGVDGHTDDVPLGGGGEFADNWELSQARALSVVKYLTDELGFPPFRLAATGFGEFRPVNPADTSEARAQNRRIELKLRER